MSGAPRATPVGTVVAALATAALVAGSWLGYVDLLVVGCAGAVALLVGLLTVAVPARVDVTRSLDDTRVERGSSTTTRVHVSRVQGVRGGLRAWDLLPQGWQDLGAPRAGLVREYRLPALRRGRYAVGPLVITRSDPLRLWRRDRPAGRADTLWVRPRRLPLQGGWTGLVRDLEGPEPDAAPEGSTSFQGLREYAAGDDLRRVHWRSTARFGQLMVRQYLDPGSPQLAVVLDDRAASYRTEDDAEQAIDVVATIVAGVRAGGARCALHLWSGLPLPAPPPGVVDLDGAGTALDSLCEVGLTGEAPPLGLAEVGPAAVLVLVSGSPSSADLGALRAVRRRVRRCEAVCVSDQPVAGVPGVRVTWGGTAEEALARWLRRRPAGVGA